MASPANTALETLREAGSLQTIMADSTQGDFSNVQVLGDCIERLSQEMASLRDQLDSLRNIDEQLGQSIRAESVERHALARKLEKAIEVVATGLDKVDTEVKAEVSERRLSEENLVCRSVSALRARVEEIERHTTNEHEDQTFPTGAEDEQLQSLLQATAEKLALFNERAAQNVEGLEKVVRAVEQGKSDILGEDADETLVDVKTTRRFFGIEETRQRNYPEEPRVTELLEQLRAEQNERRLSEEGMRHLVNSCRQEISVVRQECINDYVALRKGLECLDRGIEQQIANLIYRFEGERQRGRERAIGISFERARYHYDVS